MMFRVLFYCCESIFVICFVDILDKNSSFSVKKERKLLNKMPGNKLKVLYLLVLKKKKIK